MITSLPQPPTKRWYQRWWLWFIIVIVLIVGAGLAIAQSMSQLADSAANATQDTITATMRTLTKTVSTNGKIVPEHLDQLAFNLAGKTTEVWVGVGDDVSKDQLLVKIDGGSFARTVDEELKAKFDGRVVAIYTFVNDTVAPGVPVIEIGYRNNFIEFIASESEVFDLHAGLPVNITVPSYNNGQTTYHGTIEFVDTQKTASTTGITATAGVADHGYVVRIRPNDLPDTVTRKIGLGVDLEIAVAEKATVLSVERAAVQYDEADQAYVYIPATTADTEPIEQPVSTDFEGDDYVEITAGLKAGDTVVLYIPHADVTSPF
ncbi:MAG: HlyD family efflux transporter periplasmic adaptor subunit [Candidatus Kerfeldbacteria bacterium]|nr:HlyD family efflux transporter periplasmic adaptor subunit [Candidatus Kerfeldbacteria bacterium]